MKLKVFPPSTCAVVFLVYLWNICFQSIRAIHHLWQKILTFEKSESKNVQEFHSDSSDCWCSGDILSNKSSQTEEYGGDSAPDGDVHDWSSSNDSQKSEI